MEFSVRDRLILLNIIPVQGSLVTLKMVRVLREELGFSDEEYQDFNLRTEGGSFHWDDDRERPKEVDVPTTMHELIISAFNKLSKENALHLEHIDLYERFIQLKVDKLADETEELKVKKLLDS